MDRKKPKIISIASLKGGVGKSSTGLIFATLLSENYKVLLIDIDTQASITSYFFNKIKSKDIDLSNINIYEVLKEDSLEINSAIISVDNNLD